MSGTDPDDSEKPVTVSGVTAEDKLYDGNTNAVLHTDSAVFVGVIAGDQISLVSDSLKGTFESAEVGTYTNKVDISIAAGKTVEDLLTGADSGNYIVDWNSAATVKKTSASITSGCISVKVNNITEVYGETPVFTVEYGDFLNGETASVITGTPIYKVRKQGTTGEFVPYNPTMGAGTYEIAVDISGLSANNYSFKVTNPGNAYSTNGQTTAILTVKKRPVAAVKGSETAVTKTYDGTTSANLASSLQKISLSSVAGNLRSGVVEGDTVNISAASANYNSKDVLSTTIITVSGITITEGSGNYQLDNNEVDINGSIEKKSLKITADSQNITYGAEAKTFTATRDGLVNGEIIPDSALTFTCEYDRAVPEKRNVDVYPITVEYADGYSNSNYSVTFIPGSLTVGKKTVTVNGASYKIIYNLNPVPVFTLKESGAYTGFEYDDTIENISGKTSNGEITFSCKDSENNDVTNVSLPKDYTILMDLKGLDADNYTFTANPGKLTIEKRELTITGIGVSAKTYDGTRRLSDLNQISYDDIEYGENLRPEDGEYLVAHDLVCVQVTSGLEDDVYNTKDVGNNKVVTLDIALTGYLADRYTLTSGEVNVQNCRILQKDLTVTADNKTIAYGTAAPSYTVSYNGFASGENKSVLGGNLSFDCTYSNPSDVNQYTITPKGYTSVNYNIQYNYGTLNVIQADMKSKAPCWDTARPGTILWSQADSIGDVEPDKYTLKLYKDSLAVGEAVTVAASETLEYDFADVIRQNGEGVYTVGITVTPSTVSNEGFKNVKQGAEVRSTASTEVKGRTLRAARVSVVMATDTISAAGVDGVDKPVYIKNSTKKECIMIAGETNVEIGVTMKNTTGYKVKSIAVDDSAKDYFTITAGTQSGESHKAAISAEQSLTDSTISAVTVTVSLQAVSPTLTVEMTQTNENHDENNFVFGYTEAVAPVYQVTPNVENDNVTTDGYTYKYTWEYKIIGKSYVTLEADSLNNTRKWETGFFANAYEIKCTVTATRKDNGLSVTKSQTKRLRISKKNFESSVIISGWNYGEPRVKPDVTSNPEQGAVTYQYCRVNEDVAGAYTTSIPTEAGTYRVKAYIAPTDNYNEITTEPKEFTITKAEFSAVDESKISMESSGTAPYGLIKWEKVPAISENAGATPVSVVHPAYAVLFAKKTDETEGAVALTDVDSSITGGDRISYGGNYYDVLLVKAGEDCLTAGSYDFTSYIKEEGYYSCFIQVYPGEYISDTTVEEFGEYNAKRDTDCSTVSVFSAALEFNGSLDVKHDGEIVERESDDSVKLIYDGLNTTLEMNYNMSGISGVTYKWYRNGAPVQESVSNIISLKNVADSGVYVCEIYINGTKQYVSPYQTINIVKRKITIQAASDHKEYDGTELTQNLYYETNTNPDEGLATEGYIADKIRSITIVGSQTNVGKSDNVASNAKIHVGDSPEDVTDNYDITYQKGTLEVTKATPELSILTESMDKVYDGTPVSNPAIAYLGVPVPGGTEGERTDLIQNKTGASDVVIKYYKKNVSGEYELIDYIPKNAGEYKVVVSAAAGSNYFAAENADKIFMIKQRRITIKADDANKEYDGTPLTKNSFSIVNNTVTDEGLAKAADTPDELISVEVTGSQTNAGQCDNIPDNAVIRVGHDGEDVTANYDISYTKGKLLVTEATPVFKITAVSLNKTYDGTEVLSPATTYTGVGGISIKTDDNVSFRYYKKGTTGDYDIALTTAPTDAGEYKVVASAGKVTNYKAVDSVFMTFAISKRNITIKADDADKTYDGTELKKAAYSIIDTGAGEGLAEPEGKTGDKLISVDVTGSLTNVGNVPNVPSNAVIRIGDNGKDVTANYNITYVNGKLEITKATPTLTIQTESMTRVYDGTAVTNPAVTYLGVVVPGSENGERIDLINNKAGASEVVFTYYRKSETGEYDTKLSAAPESAGEYKVIVSAAEGSNYKEAVSADKAFVILKRDITIKAGSKKRDYDGTALTLDTYEITNTEEDEGLVTGDVISNITITGSRTDVGVAVNEIKGAVIKAGNNGEEVTANYNISYTNGLLEVTEAAAVFRITTEALNKTYDGTAVSNPSVSYTGVGGVSIQTTDNVTFRYYKKGSGGDYTTELANAPKDAGEYKVIASAAKVKNYKSVDNQELTFVIGRRNITIQGKDANKTYDGTELILRDYIITNIKPDEGLAKPEGKTADVISSVDITGSRLNVGESPNTPSGAVIKTGNDGEDVTANYNISYTNGTLKITPATPQLTITTDTLDKVYNGVEITAPEAIYTGVNGIDLIENPEGASEVVFSYYKKNENNLYDIVDGIPKNAGEYKVVASAEAGDNYIMASDELLFTISKRNITIKANDDTKVYDGTELINHSYTIMNTSTDEGLAAPEGRQPDKITDYTITGSQTDVGLSDNVIEQVVIRVGDSEGENVTDSYNISLEKGSLEVGKAPSTIVITKCDDKEYDGETVVPSYEYSGDGEVTFIYMNEEMQILDKPPVESGSYYVRAESKNSKNYFEAVSGVAAFKINIVNINEEEDDPSDEVPDKFNIEVGNADSWIYIGQELEPDITVTYLGKKLVQGVDFRIEYTDNIEKGVAGIRIIGMGNYSGSIERSFSILERKLVIRTESSSKDYDGTPLACDKYTISKYYDESSKEYVEKSGLAQNHRAIVKLNGSRTEVGVSDNTIESVQIVDENGKDVTSNYKLIYQLGTLEVKEAGNDETTTEEMTEEPTTEEPTTEEPTTEEPTTEEPTMEEPTTEEPTTEESTTEKPSTEEATTEETSAYNEQDTEESSIAEDATEPSQEGDVENQPESSSEDNNESGTVPSTGDDSNILLCWILCIMSGSVIVVYRRKKRGNR